MALMTTKPPSSAGSDSHASSPELEQPSPDMAASTSTQDASPISLPSSLMPTQPASEGERDERSSRSTPTRSSPVELTRSRSAGRGGCWTCRVRRKKCDEERVEGDSCKTCRRLGIECLGWGPRRPDWMRDKDKVAEYKANIKAQLTRAGLIRGQPRAIYNSLASPGAAAAPLYTTGVHALERYPPSAVAGPGPSTSTLRRSRVHVHPSPYAHPQHYDHPLARPSTMMSGVPGLEPLSAPAGAPPEIWGSLNHGAASVYNGTDIQLPSLPPYGYPANADLPPPPPPTATTLPPARDVPLTEQDYVQYFFENVRQLQFVFAGNNLTETLYYIVSSEPQPAVAYAVRALAALHMSRTRYPHGIDTQIPEQSVHRQFYDQSCYYLSNIKTMGSQYTEFHVVAAIYLIAYHQLLGGGTNWTTFLEVAYDWFEQMGIQGDRNPKLRLVNMSPVQKFAAKATMWIDIMAAVTFVRVPRFLSVYRQLFGQGGAGGAGFWAAANNDQLDLRMDKLTGCPDEALLAIAEIAGLAYWKKREAAQGTLSMRDLIRQGDQIEQTLRQRPARNYAESPTAETVSAMPSGLASAAGMVHDITGPDETTRLVVAQIYRESAVLYLHTVLSESQPGVPEIVKSVDNLLNHYQQLRPSEFDRAIVFPLTLTGCLSADPLFREMLRGRCNFHQDAYWGGSLAQARTAMEQMWTSREALNPATVVDWRDVVRERWSSLFTI